MLTVLTSVLTTEQKGDALVSAASGGQEAAAARLLSTGANPDAAASAALASVDLAGCTALHAAVIGRHEGIVGLLLNAGADTERESNGYRPLQLAARCDRPGCVRRLLAAGANPDAQDARGRSALHHAAWASPNADRPRVVALLLRGGANRALEDDRGKTAREYAEARGHAQSTALLRGGRSGRWR